MSHRNRNMLEMAKRIGWSTPFRKHCVLRLSLVQLYLVNHSSKSQAKPGCCALLLHAASYEVSVPLEKDFCWPTAKRTRNLLKLKPLSAERLNCGRD